MPKGKITAKEREARRAANVRANTERLARIDAERQALLAKREDDRAARIDKRRNDIAAMHAVTKALRDSFVERLPEITEEVLDQILVQVSEGEVFTRTCLMLGAKPSKVRKFIRDGGPEIHAKWDLAMRLQAESWADDIMNIADTADAEEIAAVKLRVEVRKWLMGKNNMRFADKTTVAMEGGDPNKPILNKVEQGMSAADAQAAFQAMLKQAKGEA